MNCDEKIRELHTGILRKRSMLKLPKGEWKTNKIVILFGRTYNLNVLSEEQLWLLGAFVKTLIAGGASLAMDIEDVDRMFNSPIISDENGNSLRDIISDIIYQLQVLYYRREKAKWDKIEQDLLGKLSEDAKTEQLLNEISKMLGG